MDFVRLSRTGGFPSFEQSVDKGFRTLYGDIPVGMFAELLLVVQFDGPLPAVRRERSDQGKRHSTMFHGNLLSKVNHRVKSPVPARCGRAIKSEGA
jgi:hypothetical protein